MAFSRGFNPGDSSVTEVADTKQADKEHEIAAHGRVAEDARRRTQRVGLLDRLRLGIPRQRRR